MKIWKSRYRCFTDVYHFQYMYPGLKIIGEMLLVFLTPFSAAFIWGVVTLMNLFYFWVNAIKLDIYINKTYLIFLSEKKREILLNIFFYGSFNPSLLVENFKTFFIGLRVEILEISSWNSSSFFEFFDLTILEMIAKQTKSQYWASRGLDWVS